MTQPQDKMRAEFEAWAKDCGYQRDELARCKIGIVSPEYYNQNTEYAWQAWQAACAQQSAQSQQDILDAVRLDFMIAEDAFLMWTLRDGTIEQCQLMTQDEDENYHFLSGEHRFFNTPREAVDAAIATQGASNV